MWRIGQIAMRDRSTVHAWRFLQPCRPEYNDLFALWQSNFRLLVRRLQHLVEKAPVKGVPWLVLAIA